MGSYETQFGTVAERRCEWPSSCWRPSPFSVVRPAVAAEQEASRARVARRPGEVADPLESEHRVEDVEGDHLDAVVRVRGRGGDPRGHRSRLGDALLEDLALLVLAVEHERAGVLGLIQLADVRVDPELAEHALHPEGPCFVGHDRHDPVADLLVANERGENADERHRRRDLALVGAVELRLEGLERRNGKRLVHLALAGRKVAAEPLPALFQVADLVRVIGRLVEGDVGDLLL